jgi:uncharacterized protein YndB with AHSA1/START domain
MKPALIAVALLLTTSLSRAAVIDSGSGGFTVQHQLDTSAPHAAVFQKMVTEVASWWLDDHTWSGDAANLSIEQRAGGCFCEQLPQGGSVEHLRVVYIQPGSLIRLQGGLGPLQEMGANGAMSWSVTPNDDGGSRIEWRYRVHGHLESGFDDIAAAVDRVLGQQLAGLGASIGQP